MPVIPLPTSTFSGHTHTYLLHSFTCRFYLGLSFPALVVLKTCSHTWFFTAYTHAADFCFYHYTTLPDLLPTYLLLLFLPPTICSSAPFTFYHLLLQPLYTAAAPLTVLLPPFSSIPTTAPAVSGPPYHLPLPRTYRLHATAPTCRFRSFSPPRRCTPVPAVPFCYHHYRRTCTVHAAAGSATPRTRILPPAACHAHAHVVLFLFWCTADLPPPHILLQFYTVLVCMYRFCLLVWFLPCRRTVPLPLYCATLKRTPPLRCAQTTVWLFAFLYHAGSYLLATAYRRRSLVAVLGLVLQFRQLYTTTFPRSAGYLLFLLPVYVLRYTAFYAFPHRTLF